MVNQMVSLDCDPEQRPERQNENNEDRVSHFSDSRLDQITANSEIILPEKGLEFNAAKGAVRIVCVGPKSKARHGSNYPPFFEDWSGRLALV